MSKPCSFVRVGARKLSKGEVCNILPTYNKLLDQIEEIRLHRQQIFQAVGNPANEWDNSFAQDQATNNISILGVRGSGKSSVLKTLYNDLIQGADTCNLLLPPIVPENMESHMTLMSCILGMLKPIVHDLAKKNAKSYDCCPQKKTDLEKSYKHLLETYLRLQEPYQKISVQQYSTEAEYLRTMADVFEASNKFILDFKRFINILLQHYSKPDTDKQPLLFIFIDDIDLSAYRCADLLKTLLTYLAHPSIVTILAGDLTIFGESLTLNFLRQEGLLGESSIEKNFLVEQVSEGSNTSLLARKKILAYDHLKKVLPPMYRHYTMLWSLDNRAVFCPKGVLEAAIKTNPDIPTLEQQLQHLEKVSPMLEGYFRSVIIGNTTYRPAALYNIFDNTARGLANAYAALEQFLMPDDNNTFREKALLESLISSNYELNNYRNLLLYHFIQFGPDLENSHVYFDNFTDWLNKKDSNDESPWPKNDPLQQFRLFVYLDFAARLLNDTQALSSAPYTEFKNQVLLLLCSIGSISEKQFELTASDRDKIKAAYQENFSTKPIQTPAKKISIQTLFRLPFPLAVLYAQIEEPRQNIDKLNYNNKTRNEENIMLKVDYVTSFLNLIQAYYSAAGDGAPDECLQKQVKCLQDCPEMLSLLENLLQQDKSAFLISATANPYFVRYYNKKVQISPLYEQYACKSFGLIGSQQDSCFKISQQYLVDFWKRNSNKSCYSFLTKVPHKKYDPESITIELSSYNTRQKFDASVLPGDNFLDHVFWQLWVAMFIEPNAEAAIPFYNCYVNELCSNMLDKNYRVQPLEKYSSKEIETYFGKVARKKAQQMAKILLAVDKIGWGKTLLEEVPEETPISFVKHYVQKQLQESELALLENEYLTTFLPSIDVCCIEQEIEDFEKAYKGSHNTLATGCLTLLGQIFAEYGGTTEEIDPLGYLYLRVILKAFLNSKARYCKPEARALLEALNKATWKFTEPEESKKRYQFWFHCYCRYRQAEMSDEVDQKLDHLYTYKTLIKGVWTKTDPISKKDYLTALQQETELEESDIAAISKLFS